MYKIYVQKESSLIENMAEFPTHYKSVDHLFQQLKGIPN